MNIIPAKEVTVISTNVTPTEMADIMFDEYLNTQTVYADIIDVVIEFNNVDRLALFNIDGYTVDLDLTDMSTSTLVQSKTIDLALSGGGYQTWLIEPMYIYANAQLRIRIYKSGDTAKCGKCGHGLNSYIGTTIYDVTTGFQDYSIKDINGFGYVYINEGFWAKTPSLTLEIDYDNIDNVYEDLISVRGVLAFFEGNEDDTGFELLRVYGFLDDWSINITNPAIATVNLSIQGAI